MYLMAPGSEFVNGQTIAIDGAEYQAAGGDFSRLREWSDAQWREARRYWTAERRRTLLTNQ